MAAHPLKYKWTFHGHTVDKSKDFEANQLVLASFDTVEDFWSAWYSIARPSQLFATRDWRKEPVRTAPVSAICMFKDGIEPKWEDPANTTGGQWFCQPSLDGFSMDKSWEGLVLGLISGTSFGGADGVCGIRLVNKNRKGTTWCSVRIELWFNETVTTDEARDAIMDELVTEIHSALAQVENQRSNRKGKDTTPHVSRTPPDLTCKMKIHAAFQPVADGHVADGVAVAAAPQPKDSGGAQPEA